MERYGHAHSLTAGATPQKLAGAALREISPDDNDERLQDMLREHGVTLYSHTRYLVIYELTDGRRVLASSRGARWGWSWDWTWELAEATA